MVFECYMMDEVVVKLWLGDVVDWCFLKDIVNFWYKLYGILFFVGEYVYEKLLLIVDVLGNFLVILFILKMFVYYCDKCLMGEIYFSEKWKNGVSFVMVNFE